MSWRIKKDPVEQLRKDWKKLQPLPLGRAHFGLWSDRIISAAMIPAADSRLLNRALKWALATELLHLGKTEDHKEDAYFIHLVRKAAVNEVAATMINEIKAEQDAEKKAMLDRINQEKAAQEKAKADAEAAQSTT